MHIYIHDTWIPEIPACPSDYFNAVVNRWLSALFAKSDTVPTVKYCQALEVLRLGGKTPQFNLCLFSSQSEIQIYNFSPLKLSDIGIIFFSCES